MAAVTAVSAIARVALNRPFTPREHHVVEMVAAGYAYPEIARQLRISRRTVETHVNQAAGKIPGSLPARARLVAWYRGATLDVLA